MTDTARSESGRHSPGRSYAYAHRAPAPPDELIARCPWCASWHSHGAAAVVDDPFIDSRVAHCLDRPRPGMYVLTIDPELIGQACTDYPPEWIAAARLSPRDLDALDAQNRPIGSDPAPSAAEEVAR